MSLTMNMAMNKACTGSIITKHFRRAIASGRQKFFFFSGINLKDKKRLAAGRPIRETKILGWPGAPLGSFSNLSSSAYALGLSIFKNIHIWIFQVIHFLLLLSFILYLLKFFLVYRLFIQIII